MTYATTVSALTKTQAAELLNACLKMLENDEDYTHGFEHSVAYAYYNEDSDCMEAWLTNGNHDMSKAAKYELICSYQQP